MGGERGGGGVGLGWGRGVGWEGVLEGREEVGEGVGGKGQGKSICCIAHFKDRISRGARTLIATVKGWRPNLLDDEDGE